MTPSTLACSLAPQGAPVKQPISARRVEVRLEEAERALRKVPGVSGAKVSQRSVGGKPVLVAFATPPSIDARAVQVALAALLDEYNRPGLVVPVAAIPQEGEDLAQDTQETLEQLFSEVRCRLHNLQKAPVPILVQQWSIKVASSNCGSLVLFCGLSSSMLAGRLSSVVIQRLSNRLIGH